MTNNPTSLSPSRPPPELPHTAAPTYIPIPVSITPATSHKKPTNSNGMTTQPPRFEGPDTNAPLFIPPPPTHVVGPPTSNSASNDASSSHVHAPVIVPISAEQNHTHALHSSTSSNEHESHSHLAPMRLPTSTTTSVFNSKTRPPSFDAPPVGGPPFVSSKLLKRYSHERKRDSQSGPVSSRVLNALRQNDHHNREPVRRRRYLY